jgi:hypothetical protein
MRQPHRGIELESPAEADAGDQAPVAELVQRRQALGELDRSAQGSQENRDAQPDAPGECGAVGEEGHRLEAGRRAEDLLLDPHALVPERVDPAQERPEVGEVESRTGEDLGHGDAEAERGFHCGKRLPGKPAGRA